MLQAPEDAHTVIHVDHGVPGAQLGKAFERYRPAKPTPAPDSPRAAENLVVRKHLKGRGRALQYETGEERTDDHVRPGWNFLGTPEDFLEPVTLPLVVAEQETATARGGNGAE